MNYSIHQEADISVYRNDDLFLFVKRKSRWNIISEFIKGGRSLVKIRNFAVLHLKWLSIISQSFHEPITLVRENSNYSLIENQNSYFIQYQSGLFEKELIGLYLNEVVQGSIISRYFAKLGGREYIMETVVEDDKHDLFFLILFISQLNDIV